MTADGLGTAILVPGPKRGIELARKIQVDVMFLEVEDAGRIVETSIGLVSKSE